MSAVAELMDAWFAWHVHYGTVLARTWTPTPATEAEITRAVSKLGGPAWPDEVKDLYRWCNGCPHSLLPFGTLASLDSLLGSSHRTGNAWEETPAEVAGPEEEFENPYALMISLEYPCIHVDRAGTRPGRVWALDCGDGWVTARSLSEYLEAVVYMAGKGMVDESESERTLVFKHHSSAWGPAFLTR